jgi:hypothetical protein
LFIPPQPEAKKPNNIIAINFFRERPSQWLKMGSYNNEKGFVLSSLIFSHYLSAKETSPFSAKESCVPWKTGSRPSKKERTASTRSASLKSRRGFFGRLLGQGRPPRKG